MAAVLAEIPALPLHTAGKYVAGAYIVVFVIVLIYVAIMATRLARIERELGELLELVPAPEPAPAPAVHDLDLDLDASGHAAQHDSSPDAGESGDEHDSSNAGAPPATASTEASTPR